MAALTAGLWWNARQRADAEGIRAVEHVGGKVDEMVSSFWIDDGYCVDLTGLLLTDADVIALASKLKRMTYVQYVFIDSPKVTEAVLPHLQGFPRLLCLGMNGTAVPENRVSEFCSEEGIPVIGTGPLVHNKATSRGEQPSLGGKGKE